MGIFERFTRKSRVKVTPVQLAVACVVGATKTAFEGATCTYKSLQAAGAVMSSEFLSEFETLVFMATPYDLLISRQFEGETAMEARLHLRAVLLDSTRRRLEPADAATLDWDEFQEHINQRIAGYAEVYASASKGSDLLRLGTLASKNITGSSTPDPGVAVACVIVFTTAMKTWGSTLQEFELTS
jgi:hypothetical protein